MKPPEPTRPTGSVFPLLMASVLALLVAGVLLFLSLGTFAGVLAIGVMIFAVTGLHYVVWGYWLGQGIRDEVQAEEREAQRNADRVNPPRDE